MFGERAIYNLYRAALRSRPNPVPVLPGASIPAEATRTEVSPLRRKAAAVAVAVAIFGAGHQAHAYSAEARLDADLEAAWGEQRNTFARAVEAHRALELARAEGAPAAVVSDFEERAEKLSAEHAEVSGRAAEINGADWKNRTLGGLLP